MIVILISFSTLSNLPTWLTSAFAITPGEYHADGVTKYKLILCSDGIFPEVVAFIPSKEAEPARQRWGIRPEGKIIDWADTLCTDEDLEIIRARVKKTDTDFTFEHAVGGGERDRTASS